jgi:hypothetical protein
MYQNIAFFWGGGCRVRIRTQDCLTAVRHADLSAMPHPYQNIAFVKHEYKIHYIQINVSCVFYSSDHIMGKLRCV